MPKKRKIIVVGKLRRFDDETWKRLIMAYTYYLHEQQVAREAADEQRDAPNGGSQ